LIRHIVDIWHNDGLPASVPFFITESNPSSSTSETYEDIFGGFWLAEYMGSFLSSGGSAVYYLPYLPLQLERGCNNCAGSSGCSPYTRTTQLISRYRSFYTSQMTNQEWLQADGTNEPFTAASEEGPILHRRVTSEGGFDLPAASVVVLTGTVQP
jgi:hypothetical protein